MKLIVGKFIEDFFEDDIPSQLNTVSIKDCLRYTSYGFFIGAIFSLFQGDIDHVIISLLIAIFLKL